MRNKSLVVPRRAVVACLLLSCAPLVGAAEPKHHTATELGAVADGTTVNTRILQYAIDRIPADGGGTLVIPKGTFLSGALYFKPGVNLLVEKDGILKSTPTMAGFPQIYMRRKGIERYWTPGFLNSICLAGIAIPRGRPAPPRARSFFKTAPASAFPASI